MSTHKRRGGSVVRQEKQQPYTWEVSVVWSGRKNASGVVDSIADLLDSPMTFAEYVTKASKSRHVRSMYKSQRTAVNRANRVLTAIPGVAVTIQYVGL